MKKGCARAHVQMHPTSDLCKSSSQLVYKHTSKLNAIGPTVMELSRVGYLRHPLTRHVSGAVAGTGGYRCRSNTKYIEWWHQTKKTACESVDLFQRYKLLKSVTGSGWVGLSWVGSGWVGPRILRFLRWETEELAPPFVLAKHFIINSNCFNVLDAPLLFTELQGRSYAKQVEGAEPVNPRPAGPLDFPPPAGGGAFARPPMISAPGRRREKRKAAIESSRKIISKSFRSFFGSGQNWGHQGSKLQNFPKRFFKHKIFNF